MNVIKRDGRQEGVDFNKVTNRIKKLTRIKHSKACLLALLNQFEPLMK